VSIGAPWDAGVDIWSLGCLVSVSLFNNISHHCAVYFNIKTENQQVVEFVQGIVLFSGEASDTGSWTAEDDHLARIFEVLGPFPLHFIETGNRAAHFFDKKGIFYQGRSYPVVTLMWISRRKPSSNP
jgi:serine/threonine-protein kinase SRPK3